MALEIDVCTLLLPSEDGSLSLKAKHGKLRAIFPCFILQYKFKWKDIASISGPPGLRLVKGFHDEALSGRWKGYRSSRLGIQWRVIYSPIPEDLLFQVASITAYDYRRP